MHGSVRRALLVALMLAACRSAPSGNEDGDGDANDGGASDSGGNAGSVARGGALQGGASGAVASGTGGDTTMGGEAGDAAVGGSVNGGVGGGGTSGTASGGSNGGTNGGAGGAGRGGTAGTSAGSGAGGSGGVSGGNGGVSSGSGGAAAGAGRGGAAGNDWSGLGEPGTCPLRQVGATGAESGRLIPLCCAPSLAEQALLDELVSRINQWRLENDQPVLRFDPLLSAVAQAHSVHMGTHRFFAVEAPEVTYRLTSTRAGYCGAVASDESNFIVAGPASPAEVIETAMVNEFGRMQLLTRANSVIGVGYSVTDRPYWTMLLR